MPQPSSPKRRRGIMRAFKIDELSAVTRPAQEGARALIMKSADAALPPALASLGADSPDVPALEASPEERADERLRNTALRDRAEREAAARDAQQQPMTLHDIDVKLEGMAADARTDDETVEQAYRRLLIEREPAFIELLGRRERVELLGPEADRGLPADPKSGV